MDIKLIPNKLQHLIPLVEKWGIEDDSYRDEAIFNAKKIELEELVNSISEEDALVLENWFCNPSELKEPSNEYIKFSVFFMAFEYAKSILKNRSNESFL
jgi:hypothetical protein